MFIIGSCALIKCDAIFASLNPKCLTFPTVFRVERLWAVAKLNFEKLVALNRHAMTRDRFQSLIR